MGRTSAAPTSPAVAQAREFEGVVRGGVIVVDGAELPEGTRVQIRVRDRK
jgi:hypothetical protein